MAYKLIIGIIELMGRECYCYLFQGIVGGIVTRTEPEPVKPAGLTGSEPRPVQTAPLNRFRLVPYGTGFFV
jgi:hypothetical protein